MLLRNDYQWLIDRALAEDLRDGDLTTQATLGLSGPRQARARIVAKQQCVVCGLPIAADVFLTHDPSLEARALADDGDKAKAGDVLMTIDGSAASLLSAERVALNFLQHLSGVATLSSRFVERIAGSRARIVDTRKTTPGWRMLEKYAVRCGGAFNHRYGLYDGVLIKDNHIAAAGGILPALSAARAKAHHLLRIEIEVSDIEQARQAVDGGADVLLLDNCTPQEVRNIITQLRGRCLFEVSGGVSLGSVADYAAAGADFISAGALTHSAAAADIALYLELTPQ